MASNSGIKYFIVYLILMCLSTNHAQNGVVKSFYPDRTVKSEISYVNDILDGSSIWYHPNGKVKLEKNYSKGILNGWMREFYENGKLKDEYNVKNGLIDGDRKKYFEDGTLAEILSYFEGKLNSSKQFEQIALKSGDEKNINDLTSKKENAQTIKPAISDRFENAVPIGGTEAIQSKLLYPKDALSYGLEGIVTLNALISKSGEVIKTDIVNGLGLGCSEAAVEAVKSIRFIPGKKNDEAVESSLNINVEFKMPKVKKDIAEIPKVEKEPIAKPARKFEEHLSVICEADRCPRPEDDLATIYSLMEIPNVAKALKLKGMILIEGIVDVQGNLKQTKIIEGVGYGCDQQVESALLKSKFTPATKKDASIEAKALINFPFNYEMAR